MSPSKSEKAEAEKRSEAAKKAAETRKRNKENGDSDDSEGVVQGHRDPQDGSDEKLADDQAEHSARKDDPLPHESHVDDPHAGRANDDSEVDVQKHREADARGEVDRTPPDRGENREGALPPLVAPGAELATGRKDGSAADVFLREQQNAQREIEARGRRITELEEQLDNEKADRKRDHGKGKGPDAGVQAIAQLNRLRKIAQEKGHVDFVDVLGAYEDSGLEWSEHERSTAGV